MILLTAALVDRRVIGYVAGLIYLFSASIGCGGQSLGTNRAGDGGAPGGSVGNGGAPGGSVGNGGAPGGSVGNGGTGGSSGGGGGTHGGAGGSVDAGSCVNVSGAGDQPWYNLTIVGTQFGADEGSRMRIVVATQSSNRVGIGDVTIVNGSFTVSMPEVLNASWYVGITLYVDRNGNQTCEPDEQIWAWTTRAVASDIHYELTPNQVCSSTFGNCTPSRPTQQVCTVGTGDTVLTEPLPCIP